jgi:anti-sigma regulatory factor (Ser/Thr protein kinase)
VIVVRTLPSDRSAARVARGVLRTFGVTNPDAEMVVSELVTNAFLHGTVPITLTIERTNEIVRVAVHDERGDFGPPTDQSYGLDVVRSLTIRWGIEPIEGNGKTVWADLAA